MPAAPGAAAFVTGGLNALALEVGAGAWQVGANHVLASGLEFPLLIERAAVFDRASRLDTLPGGGALHVYPSFVASFEDVEAAVLAFLPAERGD